MAAPPPQQQQQEFTLAQVSKHNTHESCWTVVHGQVLDLTEFLRTHPGGSQIILAAGIDSTILVESYHPRPLPGAIMEKLVIGRVARPPGSYYEVDTRPEAFYPTLKRRVHAHLKSLGVQRRGSLEIHVKAAAYLATLAITYVLGWIVVPHLYFHNEHEETSGYLKYVAWALAVVHGVAAAHVGTSIMHDANHGAFSTNGNVNAVLGHTLDLIGASGCVWSFQHVVSHHAFTNLETRTERNLNEHRNQRPGSPPLEDADIQFSHENDVDVFSSFPFVRMHPADERHAYHRFQHIYSPVLFGLFTLVKIFFSDLSFYLSGRVSHVDMHPRMHTWQEHAVFLGLKGFNMSVMLFLPAYLYGPWFAAQMLFIAHFVAGEYLAICFIVSHISEAALFYRGGSQVNVLGAEPVPVAPDQAGNGGKKSAHPRDWAAKQATSTVNWAPESWFWGAFSGGLNTQLEHHLFPGVNHTAYRFMPPVMREVCKEFNVPYVEVPTLYQAVVLCLRYLRELGRLDNPETGPEKVS